MRKNREDNSDFRNVAEWKVLGVRRLDCAFNIVRLEHRRVHSERFPLRPHNQAEYFGGRMIVAVRLKGDFWRTACGPPQCVLV